VQGMQNVKTPKQFGAKSLNNRGKRVIWILVTQFLHWLTILNVVLLSWHNDTMTV